MGRKRDKQIGSVRQLIGVERTHALAWSLPKKDSTAGVRKQLM